MKANNLFDEYKALFSDDNIIVKNSYMINRLLSFSKQGFHVATESNRFINRIPNEFLSIIYKQSVGNNQKVPFVKYAKITKEKEPILKSKISRLFNCSSFHAKQIIMIYRKIGIKIEEKFGLKLGE